MVPQEAHRLLIDLGRKGQHEVLHAPGPPIPPPGAGSLDTMFDERALARCPDLLEDRGPKLSIQASSGTSAR